MKNRASGLLKRIITMITTMAKNKTLTLKSKTRAIKTRLIIFSLLRNKKILMTSITDKLRSLVGHDQDLFNKVIKEEEEEEEDEAAGDDVDDQSKAVVSYNAMSLESLPNPTLTEFQEEEQGDQYGYGPYSYDDDDKYPDLTHSLFDSADLDASGSVIELVKKSKAEGEEFRLEDEIDQVADLFIRKFHRQIRFQKQLSFKEHMDMLERTA
ncbi:hypothetical protein LWI28_019754 [Acer negundo]|uniref:Uncharacterized protein n=1 Tax=Acer negundo TaxID=4023 RepID=A0AAD5IW72_ACENE|nr:hypothetical protein LWI28_019754 [Acer negundo]KAK4846948.1 hypothetical protein QYF36_023523 [Acer negundo]